jgi:hypothetical protein
MVGNEDKDMKTKVSAKDRRAFAEKATEVIRQAGGREQPDDTGLYSWLIPETRCGPLYLHVADAGSHGLGFVAGCFACPDRAVAVLGAEVVNKHSGKWNHHYFNPWGTDDAVVGFEWSLKRVLIVHGADQA